MTDVRLAEVTRADVPALLDMMADFNALEGIPWARASATPPLELLLASPALGTVQRILEGDSPCGYFVLTFGFDLEWSGRDAVLTELYLLPEARGRGLGRAALALVARLAASHGARALHLMVRPENEPAVRLYRGAGFESPARVLMTKLLAPE